MGKKVKKENEVVTYGALEEVDAEEVSGGDGGGERAAGEGEHGVARVGGGGGGWWWRRWRMAAIPAHRRRYSNPGSVARLVGWWSRVRVVCGLASDRTAPDDYCTIHLCPMLNSNSLHFHLSVWTTF
jgi:hypothetical protein